MAPLRALTLLARPTASTTTRLAARLTTPLQTRLYNGSSSGDGSNNNSGNGNDDRRGGGGKFPYIQQGQQGQGQAPYPYQPQYPGQVSQQAPYQNVNPARGGGFAQGPQGGYQQGPQGYAQGPQGYAQGPQGYAQGPQGYAQGPQGGYQQGPPGGYRQVQNAQYGQPQGQGFYASQGPQNQQYPPGQYPQQPQENIPHHTGSARDILPNVNEESQAMEGYLHGPNPQVDEYGTPVGEVINRTPGGRENAPEVLKKPDHHLAKTKLPEHQPTATEPELVSHVLHETLGYPSQFKPTFTENPPDPYMPISKFPLPPVPIPATNRLRDRYPGIVEQVTNLLMEHGQKARAQKYMDTILRILRTKPTPRGSDKYTLVANHPPLETLPLNPILYLQTAIDSVAPLVRIKNIKGSGGFANQVPVPLNRQQRRRTAVMWMLQSVEKKAGSMMRFPERFAEEVVAVLEGRSAAWERRTAVHKVAVASRSNVKE